MEEIFESFIKSLERFKEILKEKKTVANRDSSIQRFEFTVELARKSIQKFLREPKNNMPLAQNAPGRDA